MSLSLEHWKKNFESAKKQLAAVKERKTSAIKQIDATISAQTNPAVKKRYRDQKAAKKKEFDNHIIHFKRVVEDWKSQKPKK